VERVAVLPKVTGYVLIPPPYGIVMLDTYLEQMQEPFMFTQTSLFCAKVTTQNLIFRVTLVKIMLSTWLFYIPLLIIVIGG
jgi:hypothetical protein